MRPTREGRRIIGMADDPLSEPELLVVLREEVDKHATSKQAAESLGVSAQYLGDVLHKRRAISTRLALALGYEKQTVFVAK